MTDGAGVGARCARSTSLYVGQRSAGRSSTGRESTSRHGPAPSCSPTSPGRRRRRSRRCSGTSTTPRSRPRTATPCSPTDLADGACPTVRGSCSRWDATPAWPSPTQSVGGGAAADDLPAAITARGAVYVAATGYGYGDQVSVGLQERLMTLFAGELDGAVSLGDALRNAKQAYFAGQGLYGAYDEKALSSTILYGLPMFAVGTERPRRPVPETRTRRPRSRGQPGLFVDRLRRGLHVRRRAAMRTEAGSRPTPAPARSCRRSRPAVRCSHGGARRDRRRRRRLAAAGPRRGGRRCSTPTASSPTSTPPSAGRRSTPSTRARSGQLRRRLPDPARRRHDRQRRQRAGRPRRDRPTAAARADPRAVHRRARRRGRHRHQMLYRSDGGPGVLLELDRLDAAQGRRRRHRAQRPARHRRRLGRWPLDLSGVHRVVALYQAGGDWQTRRSRRRRRNLHGLAGRSEHDRQRADPGRDPGRRRRRQRGVGRQQGSRLQPRRRHRLRALRSSCRRRRPRQGGSRRLRRSSSRPPPSTTVDVSIDGGPRSAVRRAVRAERSRQRHARRRPSPDRTGDRRAVHCVSTPNRRPSPSPCRHPPIRPAGATNRSRRPSVATIPGRVLPIVRTTCRRARRKAQRSPCPVRRSTASAGRAR